MDDRSSMLSLREILQNLAAVTKGEKQIVVLPTNTSDISNGFSIRVK